MQTQQPPVKEKDHFCLQQLYTKAKISYADHSVDLPSEHLPCPELYQCFFPNQLQQGKWVIKKCRSKKKKKCMSKKEKKRNVGQGGEQQDKMGRRGCGQKKGESLMCRIKKPKAISHLVDSIHSHLLPEQLSVLLRLKSWKLNFLNFLQLGSQMGIRAVPQQPLNVASNALLKNYRQDLKNKMHSRYLTQRIRYL